MEQYIVSARKYRPATFESVVGQQALTSTLKNAIASDRLAHAYLFCGSRGVGKTSCARIFAKTINCSNPHADGEACNECDSCRAFNDGNSMNIIELDAASHNGIDDMKALIEQVQVPPTQGRYRVFIIDEVHMLSTAAFNAFLKTLEEPPSYVIFILATTEKHKIIPTILSRCQIYDFNRISITDMVAHLQNVAAKEGITAEPAALNVIARQADGAMRDALSIFDQVAASSRGNITYETTIQNLNVLDNSYYTRLLDALTGGDIPAGLVVYHEVRRKGFDSQFFLNGLGQYLRDLMLASSPATLRLLDAPDDVRATMAEQAAKLKPDFLYSAMGLCNDADLNYRQSSNKQLLIELTLIRIAQLLSPSPVKSGRGEGQLKPIAKPEARQATPAPTPQIPAPTVAAEPAPLYQTQPRTAAPTPPPAATARTTGPTVRLGALSMNGSHHKQSATSDSATAHRSEAITPDKINAAWEAFIAGHASEHAIINIMRQCSPIRGDGKYVLTVLNDVQANLLKEHYGSIITEMRNSLKNDDFEFEIAISSKEPAPMFWNEHQVLSHMLDNNPEFRNFYKTLGLNLL